MLSLPILALALAAPMSKDDSKPDLAKQIVGEWILVKMVVAGMDYETPSNDDDGIFVYIFRADGTVTNKNGDKKRGIDVNNGTYKLDTAKNPAELDLKFGQHKEEGTQRTIVKVTGDILTVCVGEEHSVRPTEFKSTKVTLMCEFKQIKKDR